MTVTEDLAFVKEKLADVIEERDKFWAESYMKQVAAALEEVATYREDDEFIRSFEKACLSADATRKLKKDKGNEYQTHVIRCSTRMQQPLNTANDLLDKIMNMGQAAHPELWQSPKKQSKTSEKRKRSAAPTSA